MSLIVKAEPEKKFEKELLPEGSHIGLCYMVVHIGTNVENIMGEDKETNKIIVGWEIPDEMRKFGDEGVEQPMVTSKEYTFSLGEKANLRKDLETWRGTKFSDDELKGFDLFNLIGAAAMLSVVHTTSKTGNKYARVNGVINLHKSTPKPRKINDPVIFDYNENYSNLSKLPEWIQSKIKTSKEYKVIEQNKSI